MKNAIEKNLPKPDFSNIPTALCHHAEFKNFYEEAKTISEEIGGKFFIPSRDFLNERAYSSES